MHTCPRPQPKIARRAWLRYPSQLAARLLPAWREQSGRAARPLRCCTETGRRRERRPACPARLVWLCARGALWAGQLARREAIAMCDVSALPLPLTARGHAKPRLSSCDCFLLPLSHFRRRRWRRGDDRQKGRPARRLQPSPDSAQLAAWTTSCMLCRRLVPGSLPGERNFRTLGDCRGEEGVPMQTAVCQSTLTHRRVFYCTKRALRFNGGQLGEAPRQN